MLVKTRHFGVKMSFILRLIGPGFLRIRSCPMRSEEKFGFLAMTPKIKGMGLFDESKESNGQPYSSSLGGNVDAMGTIGSMRIKPALICLMRKENLAIS